MFETANSMNFNFAHKQFIDMSVATGNKLDILSLSVFADVFNPSGREHQ